MKKFKLIKTYPGSPKDLGYILENPNKRGFYSYNNTSLEPANFPEFWEEVIEKDYEILAYKNHNRLFHYTVKPRLIGFEGARHYQETTVDLGGVIDDITMVNLEPIPKIHSVKRLSDDEIFTIGDRVNNSTFGGDGTIKRIRIIGDSNYLAFDLEWDKQWEDSDDSECYLENLSKLKQPLFTTEDGVDILEGDSYYFIDSKLAVHYFSRTHSNSGIHKDSKDCYYFSNVENANNFILENSKLLSFRDIKTYLDKSTQLQILKLLNNKK